MWPELSPDQNEIDDYSAKFLIDRRRGAIVPLVVHTALMTAYVAERKRKQVAPFALRLSSAGDVIEDLVASSYAGPIAGGDHETLPPFFLGDRTGLTYERQLGCHLNLRGALGCRCRFMTLDTR